MLFNSFIFLALVIVTFLLYYNKWLLKYQILILIVASLVFYAYSNIALLALLLSSVLINVLTSYYVVYGQVKRKKLLAVLGVVANLGVLAFFKYSPLIAVTFFKEGQTISEFLVSIPLPIGISFFTFQGISLVVDVYKEKHFVNANTIPESLAEHGKRTLFFIAFFPQLVAGPIVKAHDFYPQIKAKYLNKIDLETCFKYLVLGYFLKMVVADNLKDYTFWITFPYFQTNSTVALLTMLFGYSCQIFADFAGYSLIAIGLAKLFGYDLLQNFNFPYISASFQEFWKRWHISLSSFLMEYLYIPLGGNRKGKVRTYINLMITMFLGGLWHGAAWSYAIWGLFHGGALAIERLLMNRFKMKQTKIVVYLKRLMVFSFVTLAWLLFKLPEFDQVLAYFQTIGDHLYMKPTGTDMTIIKNVLIYSSPIVLYHLFYMLKQKKAFQTINKLQYVFYGMMLFLILTNSGTAGAFIYFQF